MDVIATKNRKKSKNWYHKFMYAFGPPGWSHDGSTLTVKQMQRQLELEKQSKPVANNKEVTLDNQEKVVA